MKNGIHIGIAGALLAGSLAAMGTLPVVTTPKHETVYQVSYPQRIRKIKLRLLLLKNINDPESFGRQKQAAGKQKWNKKKHHG